MTIEAKIYNALSPLVGGRVFPDVAPLSTVRPYIVYNQVGGEVVDYLENAVSTKQNGRFQLNIWADTRATCAAVMLQVETALLTSSTMQARPVSAPNSEFDHDMDLFGSMQDFTIWSDR
jgi:hypothetical protein